MRICKHESVYNLCKQCKIPKSALVQEMAWRRIPISISKFLEVHNLCIVMIEDHCMMTGIHKFSARINGRAKEGL